MATQSTASVTARTAPESPYWLERAIKVVERHWAWAIGALMLLDAAILLYMGRGFTFFYDDWNFVTEDFGGGFHSLMRAHVGNISVFPVAVYKVLFHLVGLNHYAVYRLVVVFLHLASAWLIFVLASRRIPRVQALLGTALILFLGAAWEDLLWAFQVGYMLSIAGGLATWVLMERRDRLGDVLALLCLTVSVGSSSLGIAMMVGVAVELLWRREDRWRIWIVLVPLILYVIWYLSYGESEVTKNSLIAAPGFVWELIAAAFGGLVGRGLEWGRPIALVGALVLLRRLARPLPVSPRLAGLLAAGVALWVVTAAARSTISTPETSRYIYLGAVVIVLVGVELLRGVAVGPRAIGLATVLVAFSAVTGLTVMHAGALGRRENAETVTAELGALELASAYAPPTYQPDPQGAPQIMAGPYLHTVRAIGSSPADTPAKIVAADRVSRAAADNVLLALEAPRLRPLNTTRPSPLAPAPITTAASGARLSQHGGCVRLMPLGAPPMTADLTLPSGGVVIRNEGSASAALALKRFGESFDPLTAQAAPYSVGVLSPSPDAAPYPWQLQIASSSRLSICGLTP